MSAERRTHVDLDCFRMDDGRVMVDEGHARVVEYVPKAEVERLREALRDAVDAVSSGQRGTVGWYEIYATQVNVSAVERWRDVLATSDTPERP